MTENYVIEKIELEKKHAELRLVKETGEKFKAILRDNIDLFVRTFKIGDTATCNVKEREVNGETVLDIVQIKKATIINKSVLINYDQLLLKFDEYIKNIKDPDYKKIIDSFFDTDIRKEFMIFPAAKSNHHGYKHGLLEHTVEVIEISVLLSKYLKGINSDLLVTGALLHDVGKLKAYDFDLETGVVGRTDLDELIGHLSMSALFVSKTIPEDVDPQKAILLYHIILSHHGRRDWGSPVEYKCKEAYLVHQADMISSRTNHMNALKIEKNNWTEEDKLQQKRWFIHE